MNVFSVFPTTKPDLLQRRYPTLSLRLLPIQRLIRITAVIYTVYYTIYNTRNQTSCLTFCLFSQVLWINRWVKKHKNTIMRIHIYRISDRYRRLLTIHTENNLPLLSKTIRSAYSDFVQTVKASFQTDNRPTL